MNTDIIDNGGASADDISDAEQLRSEIKRRARVYKKKRRRTSLLTKITLALLIISALYYSFIFLNIPPLRFCRNLWIETAMTTLNHQWLATYFIPDFIIDDVMANQAGAIDAIAGIDGDGEDEREPEKEFVQSSAGNDVAHQSDFAVGDNDSVGNEIIINDLEQKIMISQIKTSSATARVLQVDDPSRVFVGFTSKKGGIGLVMADMLKQHNAIAGINASGFYDANGHGNGGEVLGMSMSSGELWGGYTEDFDSICFDEDNRLIAGKIEDWESYNVRDGIQFTPILVIDGEKQLEGTAGYGLQPRTCIGQREDGSVLMLVVDGRQAGYSIGMTMEECADVMIAYGADIAVACDGGSSSVMGYNGKIITKPSGANKSDGRMLPNAFLVRRIK